MQDEKGYRSYIVDYKTAMERLGGIHGVDGIVVRKAYELWQFSIEHGEEMERQARNHANHSNRSGGLGTEISNGETGTTERAGEMKDSESSTM